MRIFSILTFGLVLSAEAATISKNARCGAPGKGTTCLSSQWGSCCSQYGWCGSTDAYCGNGCQSGFGNCKNAPLSSSKIAATLSTSSLAPSASLVQPISNNARCGTSFGGQTCQGSKWGDCCSQYFYCGSSRDYCGPQACQEGYGKCDSASSSVKSSSATSTLSSATPSSSMSSSFMASSTSVSSLAEVSSSVAISSEPSSSSASSTPTPTELLSSALLSGSISSLISASTSLAPSTSASSSEAVSSSAIASSTEIVSSSTILPSSDSVSISTIPTPSPSDVGSCPPSANPSASTFPPAMNVLLNPGFEEFSTPGPSGIITNWSKGPGGRTYPNRFPTAAHGGSAYAILNYLGSMANPSPSMFQSLAGYDTTRQYTLVFYYVLQGIYSVIDCTLSVSFGGVEIYTAVLTTVDNPGPQYYHAVTTTPIAPSCHEQTLQFDYTCRPSGTTANAVGYIFIDDVNFVSN